MITYLGSAQGMQRGIEYAETGIYIQSFNVIYFPITIPPRAPFWKRAIFPLRMAIRWIRKETDYLPI